MTFANKRYAALHYHLIIIKLQTFSALQSYSFQLDNKNAGPTAQSTASPHRHLVGCDGWGSRLTIYIAKFANSPIIIDHHRSPTLREAIDFSITSHFQMASTDCGMGLVPLRGPVLNTTATRDMISIAQNTPVTILTHWGV